MPDVGWLRGFIATAEQQEHRAPFAREVDPIAGTAIDTHLGYTVFQQLYVAEMTSLSTPDPHQDFGSCPQVCEAGKPVVEFLGAVDRVHRR